MELITVRIPKKLLEALDSLIEDGIYSSRSEAIRDAIRILVSTQKEKIKLFRGE